MERLEPVLRAAGAEHLIGAQGIGKALQRMWRDFFELEKPTHQAPSHLTDDDGSRGRYLLQPRRQVRSLADDGLLLRRALSDEVADDDEPGRDADSCDKRATRRGELADRFDDEKARPNCALRRILLGSWPAEIC